MQLSLRGFERAHGLGNDYLVVDGRTFGVAMNAARARLLCDRHRGVGSDGVLVAEAPPDGFDAAVRIFNPDGSEAEKSGNGVRIFAASCFARGADPRRPLRIHTLGGLVVARLLSSDRGRSILELSMGRVSFRMGDLPMVSASGAPSDEEWVARGLDVDGEVVVATCLSVGNPHAVLLEAPCDDETLLRLGPKVERHPQFPKRTNVQLCEVVDSRRVRALIWERGAGPTQASGSSACAVVAACVRAGLVDAGEDISVLMPGGVLSVRVRPGFEIDQTGPVQHICDGVVADGLWSELSL